MAEENKYAFGDLKIIQNDTGMDISLLEIGPECDPSLSNAIMLSMFTNKGWWGNYDKDDADIIGCDIQEIRVVSPTGRKNLKHYIESSLDWLVSQGYASEVDVMVSIAQSGKYEIQIKTKNSNNEINSLYWQYLV